MLDFQDTITKGQALTIDTEQPSTNLLDLREELVRIILGDIIDAEVYLNVRNACRQLSFYVENDIQLGIILNKN